MIPVSFKYNKFETFEINQLKLEKFYFVNKINSCKCDNCNKEIIYPHTQFNKNNYFSTASFNTQTKNKFLKICFSCLKKIFNEVEFKNHTKLFNTFNKYTIYAFKFNEIETQEIKSKIGVTLINMIAKYGEKEGSQKFNNYCKKQSLTNTFEYKKEKYGWDEKQFKKFNQSRSVTLENLINKYGEIKGAEKYKIYVDKQILTKSNEFMINKFGVDKVNEINEKKFKGFMKVKNRHSKISTLCFDELSLIFKKEFNLDFLYGKGGEIHINTIIDNMKCRYFLDFANETNKICIEFNGDYYHASPLKYKKEDKISIHKVLKNVSDIWESDKKRILNLESLGWKVFIIWEYEFKNKKLFENKIIEIKNYIYDRIK